MKNHYARLLLGTALVIASWTGTIASAETKPLVFCKVGKLKAEPVKLPDGAECTIFAGSKDTIKINPPATILTNFFLGESIGISTSASILVAQVGEEAVTKIRYSTNSETTRAFLLSGSLTASPKGAIYDVAITVGEQTISLTSTDPQTFPDNLYLVANAGDPISVDVTLITERGATKGDGVQLFIFMSPTDVMETPLPTSPPK